MDNQESKEIGCLGICAYILFGIGILGFLFEAIQGEHKDYDGEWVSFDDMTNTAIFTIGLGIVLNVIDRIRHRKFSR